MQFLVNLTKNTDVNNQPDISVEYLEYLSYKSILLPG